METFDPVVGMLVALDGQDMICCSWAAFEKKTCWVVDVDGKLEDVDACVLFIITGLDVMGGGELSRLVCVVVMFVVGSMLEE